MARRGWGGWGVSYAVAISGGGRGVPLAEAVSVIIFSSHDQKWLWLAFLHHSLLKFLYYLFIFGCLKLM